MEDGVINHIFQKISPQKPTVDLTSAKASDHLCKYAVLKTAKIDFAMQESFVLIMVNVYIFLCGHKQEFRQYPKKTLAELIWNLKISDRESLKYKL